MRSFAILLFAALQIGTAAAAVAGVVTSTSPPPVCIFPCVLGWTGSDWVTANMSGGASTFIDQSDVVFKFSTTTEAKLCPQDGNRLAVGGVLVVIPDNCVPLSVTDLPNDTLLYVYAAINSGAVSLETDTVGYIKIGGVDVKSGDASRRLIGMLYLLSGALNDCQLGPDEGKQLIRSRYNDPPVHCETSLQADYTTTATVFTEMHADLRIQVLLWGGENPMASLTGYMSNSGVASNGVSIVVDYDPANVPAHNDTAVQWGTSAQANFYQTIGLVGGFPRLSEGLHTFTATWRVNAYTGKVYGPINHGTPTSLQVMLQGGR